MGVTLGFLCFLLKSVTPANMSDEDGDNVSPIGFVYVYWSRPKTYRSEPNELLWLQRKGKKSG